MTQTDQIFCSRLIKEIVNSIQETTQIIYIYKDRVRFNPEIADFRMFSFKINMKYLCLGQLCQIIQLFHEAMVQGTHTVIICDQVTSLNLVVGAIYYYIATVTNQIFNENKILYVLKLRLNFVPNKSQMAYLEQIKRVDYSLTDVGTIEFQIKQKPLKFSKVSIIANKYDTYKLTVHTCTGFFTFHGFKQDYTILRDNLIREMYMKEFNSFLHQTVHQSDINQVKILKTQVNPHNLNGEYSYAEVKEDITVIEYKITPGQEKQCHINIDGEVYFELTCGLKKIDCGQLCLGYSELTEIKIELESDSIIVLK
ncbi:Hypothetical_protein [Hexamita inflata]|uniref:Hypothetical_protein n=2 Tax=Hexamita inflata TaxID=28002 RepID=A0ABP1J9Y0_9EUKA